MQSLSKSYFVANAPYIFKNALDAERNFQQMLNAITEHLKDEGILDVRPFELEELARIYLRMLPQVVSKEIRAQEAAKCDLAEDLRPLLEKRIFSFDQGSGVDFWFVVDENGNRIDDDFYRLRYEALKKSIPNNFIKSIKA